MIQITTQPADNPLFGQSKWWGQPDMPEELDYPEITLVDEDGEEYQDPLTFICQIRCEELAAFDLEGLLPHEGMLWFFAALDYFLGDIDSPAYPGMDDWQQKYFRVLYWPTVSSDDLHTHSIVYDDGSPVGLPAEAITFSAIPCVPPPPLRGTPPWQRGRAATHNAFPLRADGGEIPLRDSSSGRAIPRGGPGTETRHDFTAANR